MRSLLILALASCARRIPAPLLLDPVSAHTDPSVDLSTRAAVLTTTLRGDPLARSPRIPDPATVDGSAAPEAWRAWAAAVHELETGAGDAGATLQRVEDSWRGTEAVPLARGYRLQLLQGLMAGDPTASRDAALILVSRLRPGTSSTPPPGDPLGWLTDAASGTEPILQYGDRWVLEAWLAAPDLPLEPVVEALAGPAFDRLRDHPLGRVLRARATGQEGDPTPALADLSRATTLALERAAADRDNEQAAWADLRASEAARLGASDPIATLLGQALDKGASTAATDEAAGAAALAYQAQRWSGTCADVPCVGLDRTEAMVTAASFGVASGRLAHLWRVVALKEALDAMEVGHDTVIFSRAMVDLLDALLGTGAGPFEVDLLKTRKPDAGTWLAIGRGLGTDATTDWASARAALGSHLANQVAIARQQQTDPRTLDLLDRIASRATR